MESGDRENSAPAKVGLAFAKALASGDYVGAHRMLARQLRDDLQPDDLKVHYEQMTGYWGEEPDFFLAWPLTQPTGGLASYGVRGIKHGRLCMLEEVERILDDSGKVLWSR